MKGLLFIFILLIFTTSLLAQTPKVDTVVNDAWVGSDWEYAYRVITSYDSDCRILSTLTQIRDEISQIWENTFLSANTYLSGNFVSEATNYDWNKNTSSWDNNSKTVSTYNDSYKILTISGQNWVNNAWKEVNIFTYSYNNNGYLDSVLFQAGYVGPLVNISLSLSNYNNDGTVRTIENQSWGFPNPNTWNPSFRTIYTYNPDKTISQSVGKIRMEESWKNSVRRTYTYNTAGKELSLLVEEWSGANWVNKGQTLQTYDGNNNLTNMLSQRWEVSAWVNENQTTYDNNSDGTIHQSISQFWGLGATEWSNYTRNTFHYTTSCTLPLKLLVFNASRNNNEVALNWQTAEEINTSYFIIQRSTNDISFNNIGNITAKGSEGHSYGFTDNIENLKADKVYYRLQMMDKDGKFTYSKIIPIALVSYAGNIKTYPNPVKDQLFVLFNIQHTTKAQLRISDASGKIVYSQLLNTAQNNSAISINVSALSKGIYHVQLITDKGVQQTQFMKQ